MIFATNMIKTLLFITSLSLLFGCQLNQKPQVEAVRFSPQQVQQANLITNQLIKDYQKWQIVSSPMIQAYRGLKSNYDKWDDYSINFEMAQDKHVNEFLDRAKSIERDALDVQTALNLDLLTYNLNLASKQYRFRYHNFPVNQMNGLHTEVPAFMINIHQIETIEDATAYIQRIYGVRTLFNQLIMQLKARDSLGIRPPRFVYDSAIDASKKQIVGYPLDKSKNHHPIWTDFISKIETLDLYDSSKRVLEVKLKRALKKAYKPAYKKLIAHLDRSKALAGKNTGLEQYKGGAEAYSAALIQSTTTELTAEEIYRQGLSEIEVIRKEITALLPALGYDNLPTLFEYTRNNQNVYYQDPEQALADSKGYITQINQKLSQVFADIPDTPMEVMAVESFREHSAPMAFYQAPSDDGKRAGRYYMNLSKLTDMPKFQFEALAYHEALPGHHLQSIYNLSNKNIPLFRQHSSFTAYSEGWGLYAERLAKELGGYQTPWTEYGRLLMELWRANRLVIDTGLHYLGWDIETALAFRLKNTPFSETDSINAIQRYLVMPGQATSYKIGQLRILSLREKAQEALGGDFNLSNFHSFILHLGPLPLTLLERQVDNWINEQS